MTLSGEIQPPAEEDMSFGPFEIILIVVVIALLFGAKKLPELMKGMGQGVREFKNEVRDTKEQVVSAVPQPVSQIPVGQAPVSQVSGAQVPVTQVTDVPSRQLGPAVTGPLDPVTGAPMRSEAGTPSDRS